MNPYKYVWLERVAHINAQSAAWFFLFCLVVVGVGIWWGMRQDNKEDRRDAQKQTKQG